MGHRVSLRALLPESYPESSEEPMAGLHNSGIISSLTIGWAGVCACTLMLATAAAAGQTQNPPQQQAKTPATAQTPQETAPRELPRGKKLILKDGSYQVVRDYERNGDRVRYLSEERGEWEELPSSMVDWEATAKDSEAAEKTFDALAEKVHRQEEGKRMDMVADVDASLRVGDGVFLPTGEGLFVVEGKSVRLLEQAGSQIKRDKLRTIEQVMSPVPIVPGKQNVVIQGAHATLRLRSKRPEFYLREAPPDPDRISQIQRNARQGEDGPDVVLLRAKQLRSGRQLESISSLFGQEMSQRRTEISVQRWEVAPAVFRFTLSETLAPGEYVIAEILPDGLNYYVWDFGVDATSESSDGIKK